MKCQQQLTDVGCNLCLHICASVGSPSRHGWDPLVKHRIMESLRLEKTSRIIKSNRHPNPTTPAKPCPEGPHPHLFWTPPGMGTPPLPWAAWSNAWPLRKDIFPNLQSKPPLTQLEAISSHPIDSYLGEKTNRLAGECLLLLEDIPSPWVFEIPVITCKEHWKQIPAWKYQYT